MQRHTKVKWVHAVHRFILMIPGRSTAPNDKTNLDIVIDSRIASLDSGNYRANNRGVLKTFSEHLDNYQDTTDITQLSIIDCRRYAQHLRKRVRDEDDITSQRLQPMQMVRISPSFEHFLDSASMTNGSNRIPLNRIGEGRAPRISRRSRPTVLISRDTRSTT